MKIYATHNSKITRAVYMNSTFKKFALTLSLTSLLFTGCATTTLLEKDGYQTSTQTRTVKVPLITDNVIAFAKPSNTAQGLNQGSIVIVGQQNSYVLTQGGVNFIKVISQLDPAHVKVNQKLQFFSEKNDGHFRGQVKLEYVRLKTELSNKELNFFIEQGARECSESSDTRMDAQRFCFDFSLAGVVYPAVNNLNNIQNSVTALSKPYQVTIYTEKEESYKTTSTGTNPLEKLVLLPFAVALDVITLPFQAAERIFD